MRGDFFRFEPFPDLSTCVPHLITVRGEVNTQRDDAALYSRCGCMVVMCMYTSSAVVNFRTLLLWWISRSSAVRPSPDTCPHPVLHILLQRSHCPSHSFGLPLFLLVLNSPMFVVFVSELDFAKFLGYGGWLVLCSVHDMHDRQTKKSL